MGARGAATAPPKGDGNGNGAHAEDKAPALTGVE
jgi:hypothetical protein